MKLLGRTYMKFAVWWVHDLEELAEEILATGFNEAAEAFGYRICCELGLCPPGEVFVRCLDSGELAQFDIWSHTRMVSKLIREVP